VWPGRLIFEVANLPAQRRLRNVQPRGCACHILLFSDGDEVPQVAEFHSLSSLLPWSGEPSCKSFLSRRREKQAEVETTVGHRSCSARRVSFASPVAPKFAEGQQYAWNFLPLLLKTRRRPGEEPKKG